MRFLVPGAVSILTFVSALVTEVPAIDHPLPVSAALDSIEATAEKEEKEEKEDKKGLPLVADRFVDINTDEGTWISLDVSPDGRTIIFELLGDLYTLPIQGGAAQQITSGLSFDSQPRYSPNGERVVFTSDRSGGENLWILTLADGDSLQLTKGNKMRYQSPEWTPDGQYIVSSKSGRRYGRPKLWMWHVDGGSGIKLIKEPRNLKTTGAAFGNDGRYVWLAQRNGGWQYNAQLPQYQLAIYDRDNGSISQRSSRYGSAFRPTLSPDGKWLVYGTRYDEDTALILRDLETGDERWLAHPIQHDEQEARATRDVLPGMSFTPDSKELVASYGGKIWRIPINGDAPLAVPFRVETKLPLGPRVEFKYPISDDPTFIARQIRSAKPSPNGARLVFSALDRLYVLDDPKGQPRRLTNQDEIEQQPCWSPDGKWIAYVTWGPDGGHIKKVRVGRRGTRPTQLTQSAEVYRQPVWSPAGDRIVALRDPARSLKQATGPRFSRSETDLIWIRSKGGDAQVIAPADGRSAPHFGKGSERIYFFHGDRGLVSLQWDGTDEKAHLKITAGKLPDQEDPFDADLILMSPTGKQALAWVTQQLYAVTVPYVGGETPSISVSDPSSAAFPVRKLTDIGGQFPAWSSDGQRVHWSMGNAHVVYDLPRAQAADDSVKAAKKAKAALESEKKKSTDNSKKDDPDDDDDDDKKEEPVYKPFEFRVKIEVPRDTPEGTVVLRGARLITMKGNEIIENADLVIQNNRIHSLGPRGSIELPDDAERIDVSGKTIIPGFVDTHAHLRPAWGIHKEQAWQYLANLAFGVTTTRDPQTGTTDVLTYSDLVDAGRILGPRIYSTGPGVFWDERLDDLDEARHILRRYSDYYDTKTIKMYVAGNRQQRQWLIMAARELELMPTTEGSLNMKLNMTQIQDGYPGHEHCFPIYPIYNDVLRLTADSQVCYTPTLLVAYGGPFSENFWFTTEEVHDHPKLRRFVPHEQIDARSLRRPWFRREQYVFDEQAVFVKDLVEAGGRAGIGSHGQLQGLGYHWELWSVASGGISNHDALRVATILGASGIGLDTDLGSLEPGKLADLLVLNKNPLDDIRNSESIRFVMKNGRLLEGDTLDEVWPQEKTLKRQHWWATSPATAAGIR